MRRFCPVIRQNGTMLLTGSKKAGRKAFCFSSRSACNSAACALLFRYVPAALLFIRGPDMTAAAAGAVCDLALSLKDEFTLFTDVDHPVFLPPPELLFFASLNHLLRRTSFLL